MGGFTPRFAFEVVFLILLAVAAGLADLRPLVIGLVMGGAWVIVTLIEWLAWRAEQAEEPPREWDSLETGDTDDTDSWAVEEILAPLPGDEEPGADEAGQTSVLPPPSSDGPPEDGT
jgi:hypothetical protein